MKTWIRPAAAGLIAGWAAAGTAAASSIVIDFEDVPLGTEDFDNGSDGSGAIVSGGARFPNDYSEDFDSWRGFAASSMTDTTTPGFGNQYSAFAGGGAFGSSNYGVGFAFASSISVIEFGGPVDLFGGGAYVTNTTFAALSMRDGDAFSKQFGGETGTDPDFFRLTIEGFADAHSTGAVEFFLADYRFEDDSQDYIVDDWTFVDFSPLGEVDRLEFSLDSTDNGEFGMNTPAFFAIDNVAVPEPSTFGLVTLGALAFLRRRRA